MQEVQIVQPAMGKQSILWKALIRGNFLFLSYDKFLVEQYEDHSLLKFINLSILSTLSKHILWKAKENYIQDLKGVVSTTPLFFFTYGDDKLQ